MYEDYYKLNGSPFRINPDPRFFFGSKGHNRALAYLRYGLQRKEGFIVVTGSPGTGKTTLARTLLDESGEGRLVVSQLNTTQLEADDVLRMVSASFGLDHENLPKASLLKRLETFFMRRLRAGEHVLIMIDEAQNLPNASLEELRMLSNFHMGNHALVQIFLLGQQQFRDRLNAPELEQLRQRVVAACHLNPLGPVETRSYIEHRMRFVGWRGDPNITPRAFARIYAHTQGVPRRINLFCDRLLLFGALEDLHEFDEKVTQAVFEELSEEINFDADPEPDDVPETVEAPAAPEPDPEPDPSPPAPEPPPQVPDERADVIQAHNEPSPRPLKPRVTSERSVLPLSPATRRLPVDEDNQNGLADDVEMTSSLTKLITLALDFYREPERHRQVASPHSPLPEGVHELLEFAIGRLELPLELADGQVLKSNRRELKEAVRYFIREVLVAAGGDHYRVLGLTRSAPPERITAHYQILFRLFQPGQAGMQWSHVHVARINEAYNALRDAVRRRVYDATLPGTGPAQAVAIDKPLPQITATPADALEPLTARREPPHGFGKSGRRWVRVFSLSIAVVAFGALFYFNPALYGHYIASWLNTTPDGEVTRSGAVDAGVESGADAAVPEPLQEPSATVPRLVVRPIEEVQPLPPPSGSSPEAAPATTRESKPKPQQPAVKNQSGADTKAQSEIAAPAEKVNAGDVQAKTTKERGSSSEHPAPVEAQIERRAKTNSDTPKANTPSTRPVMAASEAIPEAEPKSHAKAADKRDDASGKSLAVTELALMETPKAAPALADRLSTQALNAVAEKLTRAYEDGDIEHFMDLFSVTAYTNDQVDVAGIRRDYTTLFKETDGRDMVITGMRWERDGKNARGEGEFRVAVRRNGERLFSKVFVGTIIVQVSAEGDGDPLITGLFHVYGDAQR